MQPETIKDKPLPIIGTSLDSSTNSADGTQPVVDSGSIPSTIPDSAIPQGFIADDVVSTSLNTQSRQILGSFTFGQVGAIQIGNYSSGISGQINISPNGIVGKDSGGNTSFSIDGITGNATFRGTIAAGSVVTGYLQVGGAAGDVNGHSTTISGGKITTGSITALQIAANTITASQVAAATITGDRLVSNTITASQIAAGTITASQIASGTITGTEIAANAITASKINVSTLSAVSSNMGSITSGNIDTVSSGGTIKTSLLNIGGSSTEPFWCFGTYIQSNGTLNLGADIQGHSHNLDAIGDIFCGNVNGHNANFSGSKSAILKTSVGKRHVYSMEMPDVWLADFADDKIHIDPLFLEVTEGEVYTIKTEEGNLLVFRRRKNYADKYFRFKKASIFNIDKPGKIIV